MKQIIFISLFTLGGFSMAQPYEDEGFIANTYRLLTRSQDIILSNQISIPVYGNYCGPYHGPSDYGLEPQDGIDEACMLHDMCYDKNLGGSYSDCRCDAEIVDRVITAAIETELSLSSLGMGALIGAWFSTSKCQCRYPNGTMVVLESTSIGAKSECV